MRKADYPWGMSPIAIALLVAALVLVIAAEWPRLAGQRRSRLPLPARRRRRRKTHLRVVEPDESDDFARSVERDLANLPTYDPRAKRD